VIAQVPAGTCAAVQQYRAAAAQLAYTGDAGYQLWPSVQGTPVAALDELLAYGWGRLASLTRLLVGSLGDTGAGSTTDPAAVAALLAAQGAERRQRELVLQ